MSRGRWVEIPVDSWTNPAGGYDLIRIWFEPFLPIDKSDELLNRVRAWVRLVVVEVYNEVGCTDTFRHVNVGPKWRSLLNAPLQCFKGETSAIYYVEGRAEKLDRAPADSPSLSEELVSALSNQWLKDYDEELGP